MELFKDIEQVERLHHLISRKATGTPDELAARLKTSRRNVFRLICGMKSRGFPIVYDKRRCSYCYEFGVNFIFKISVIPEEEQQKMKGGKLYVDFDNFFFSVTNSGTEGNLLCH